MHVLCVAVREGLLSTLSACVCRVSRVLYHTPAQTTGACHRMVVQAVQLLWSTGLVGRRKGGGVDRPSASHSRQLACHHRGTDAHGSIPSRD
jgi:hypothetical protein